MQFCQHHHQQYRLQGSHQHDQEAHLLHRCHGHDNLAHQVWHLSNEFCRLLTRLPTAGQIFLHFLDWSLTSREKYLYSKTNIRMTHLSKLRNQHSIIRKSSYFLTTFPFISAIRNLVTDCKLAIQTLNQVA